MKYIKYLVLLFALVFLFPMVAFAEGEEEVTAAEEQDNRVIVYFFHGDGCPHCEEARTWFNSIQETYGYKFKLVEYEVWNDQANSELMNRVSDSRNDDATGVPYILCGDKSWVGFAEETMAPEITAQIDMMYDTPVEERYDAVALLVDDAADKTEEKDTTTSDIITLIVILVVAGGIGFGIYMARKTTSE